MNRVCHHCRLQGHTRLNCHKLRALKNASDQRSRGPRNDKRTWAVKSLRGRNDDPSVMDMMKMIGAFTTCLESFTRRFESLNSRIQSCRDITPNARVSEEGYSCISITTCHALILPMLCDYTWLYAFCNFELKKNLFACLHLFLIVFTLLFLINLFLFLC